MSGYTGVAWSEGPLPELGDHADGTLDEQVRLAATEVLWGRSGRRYEIRADVVELCWNRCGVDCRCWPNRCAIDLPHRPVVAVSAVTDGDDELLAEQWAIEDAARVVLVDPLVSCWAGPTVTVAYTWGEEPPEVGVLAADELAREMAKALNRDKSCRLPRNVQVASRQGVSIAAKELVTEKGRLGLPICDLFLGTVNPEGLSSPSIVASPDTIGRHRRVP